MLLKELIHPPTLEGDVLYKVLASTLSGNHIPWRYPAHLDMTKRADLLRVLQGLLHVSNSKGETRRVVMNHYHLSLLLENSDKMFEPEPPSHIFQIPLTLEKQIEVENLISIIEVNESQHICVAIPDNHKSNDFYLRLDI